MRQSGETEDSFLAIETRQRGACILGRSMKIGGKTAGMLLPLCGVFVFAGIFHWGPIAFPYGAESPRILPLSKPRIVSLHKARIASLRRYSTDYFKATSFNLSLGINEQKQTSSRARRSRRPSGLKTPQPVLRYMNPRNAFNENLPPCQSPHFGRSPPLA